MTAHSLALVLIRILAIKLLVDSLVEVISQVSSLQMMGGSALFEDSGSNPFYAIAWIIAIFILSKLILGILLLFFSDKIANRISPSNSEKLAAHPELAPILTHIGILLIGLSTLIHNLPVFLATSYQWFQAQASMPEEFASQQNGAMIQVSLLFILSLFLILRGKTLTRGLMRLSK